MKRLSDISFRFTPDAGKVDKAECGVCGEEMNCRRSIHGPRSMVESLGGFKSYYDEFTCKHAEEEWHEQIVALRKEAKETSSFKIKTILLTEAQEVLLNKKTTL